MAALVYPGAKISLREDVPTLFPIVSKFNVCLTVNKPYIIKHCYFVTTFIAFASFRIKHGAMFNHFNTQSTRRLLELVQFVVSLKNHFI